MTTLSGAAPGYRSVTASSFVLALRAAGAPR